MNDHVVYVILVVFLVPWGLYYLLRRIVPMIINKTYPFGGVEFEKTFRKRFDEAYEKDNEKEIVKVEEDAMYARLREISKPGVKLDTRRIHIQSVMQWVSKNNYPGNKRQMDLLIKALRDNQKDPDLTEKISKQISYVSRDMKKGEEYKNTKKRSSGGIILSITPRTISRWLTITICSISIFYSGVLDKLPDVLQIFFAIFMFVACFETFRVTLNLHTSVHIGLAFSVTIGFAYAYSFWNHVNLNPQVIFLDGLSIEIDAPQWLMASELNLKSGKCGQEIIVKSSNMSDSIRLSFTGNEVILFDNSCQIILSGSQIIPAQNTAKVFYIRPANLRSLIRSSTYKLKIDWMNPKTGQQTTKDITIYLESLFWYYCRQWYLSAFGVLATIVSGFVTSKIPLQGKQ
jgi:hypothetical protein